MAILVVSVLGLAVGLVFFRKSIIRGGALAAFVSFVLAIGIALVMSLRYPKFNVREIRAGSSSLSVMDAW